MPPMLSRVQAQNETWMRKLPPANTRFRGVLHPVNPTALPTSVFILPRIAMRCRIKEPVKPRDLFHDPYRRVMLVGEHDMTLSGNDGVSIVYALFQMTKLTSWKRRIETIHPVTKQLSVSGEPTELGPIWISLENYTRADEDAGVRVTVDRMRVITNADLKLGDAIEGRTVRRVIPSLGVTVAEIA